MNTELSLFPEITTKAEEPSTDIVIISALGKPFAIGRCMVCNQLLLVDPAYYHKHEEKDKICEACNIKTANKYLAFLKKKL